MNENFLEKLNQLADRIIYLGYLNLLWILFSLIGLGILGVFPATAALFAVFRQEKINKRSPSFKMYWSYYKESFWKANLIGWILIIIGYILYMDFYLISFMEGTFADIIYSGVFAITILFFFVAFYIFPIYTHFDFKIRKYFLSSLIMVITKPVQTILIGGVTVIHLYLILNLHILIPFFGVSLWVFAVTHLTQSAFNKKATI